MRFLPTSMHSVGRERGSLTLARARSVPISYKVAEVSHIPGTKSVTLGVESPRAMYAVAAAKQFVFSHVERMSRHTDSFEVLWEM